MQDTRNKSQGQMAQPLVPLDKTRAFTNMDRLTGSWLGRKNIKPIMHGSHEEHFSGFDVLHRKVRC